MKKIQIKIDRKVRAAAIYISGKLINLSISDGHYFYISGTRIDWEDTFIAFLNAAACETEEELNEFESLLNPYQSLLRPYNDWKQVIDSLNRIITEADHSKIRASYRSVAVVYKHKLVLFVRDKADGYYYADGVKISNSKEAFLQILEAAQDKTEEGPENTNLDLVDPNWKEKAKKIRECLIDNLFEEKKNVSMSPAGVVL